MASNQLFIMPDFFLHFPKELCYGYFRFEGNGKISSQMNFPISFKPKVAIAAFFGKCKEKPGMYSILGVDVTPSKTCC